VAFAADRGCEIRFIELMRLGPARKLSKREFVAMEEALDRIRDRWPGIEPLAGGENSRRYLVQTEDGPARVGFITPVSHPFCDTCDRLRLDARGRLYACLRKSERLDLRELLRNGTDDRWIGNRIGDLLAGKGLPGDRWSERTRMSSMGG
jgi:cyclic pyranopterin phosphate synthase